MAPDLKHFEEKGRELKEAEILEKKRLIEHIKGILRGENPPIKCSGQEETEIQRGYERTLQGTQIELEDIKSKVPLSFYLEFLRDNLGGYGSQQEIQVGTRYKTKIHRGKGSGGGDMRETVDEVSTEEPVYEYVPSLEKRLSALNELKLLINLTGLPEAKELLKHTHRDDAPLKRVERLMEETKRYSSQGGTNLAEVYAGCEKVKEVAEQMILDLIKEGKL